MIRSPVFLAQPDAGFVPSLVRRLIGTASPGPGAHPRTRVFDFNVCELFARLDGAEACSRRARAAYAVGCIRSPLRAYKARQETSPTLILIFRTTI